MQFVQPIEGEFKRSANRNKFLMKMFLGNRKKSLFGLIQDRSDITTFGKPHLGNTSGGANQTTFGGGFFNDVGVIFDMGRGGNVIHQIGNIGKTTYLFQSSQLLKLGRNSHHINGLPPLVKIQNTVENIRVRIAVKMFGTKKLSHLDNGVFINQ